MDASAHELCRKHGILPIADKPGFIGNASGVAWLLARVLRFQITEKLLFIGNIFARLGRYWRRERRGVKSSHDTTREENHH
jgi:hypothetical protein